MHKLLAAVLIGLFLLSHSAYGAPFFSNVHTFSVGYQSSNAVPPTEVELWYRGPGKRIWGPYATFPKGETQLTFTAESDGIYEFYTVARDGAGMREKRPDQNSKAQQTIVVDSSAPQLNLISPRGGTLKTGQFVEIKWEVKEKYLEVDGITIELSTPDGGWEPLMANGSSSKRSYRWDVAGALEGQKRFLRISALDKAGNLSSVETAEAISFTATPKETAQRSNSSNSNSNVAGPALSNQRIFDINYHVGEVGPSGLGKVGLWYTSNNGDSWSFYSHDADLSSPIQFSAPGEGVYGFAIEVSNRAGTSSGRPQAGQRPSLSTAVDYTPPSVLLMNPGAGNFIKGRQEVEISWRAHDRGLADKPVAIYLSSDAGHSWKTLARNLENSGSWSWTTPAANSDKFRIKVELSDLAGNIGSATTAGNFVIDSTTPQGGLSKISALTTATIGGAAVNHAPTTMANSITKSATLPAPGNDLENERAFKLATIWRNRGNYRKALEYYAQIADRYNSDERFINDVAITYFKAKAYSKALELFSALVADHKESSKYHYHIGVIHFYRQRYDEAIFYFKKALEFKHDDENSHWYLAKIYYARDDIPAAMLEWKRILMINEPNSLVLLQAKRLIRKHSN